MKNQLPANIKESDKPNFTWNFDHPVQHIIFEEYQNVLVKNSILFSLSLKEKKNIFNIPTIKHRLLFNAIKSFVFFDFKINLTNQYAIVVNNWSNGYYHWVAEVIPRIIYLKMLNKDVIFIFPFILTEQYHLNSLRILDVPFISTTKSWLFFSKLIHIPNTLSNSGHFTENYFKDFRNFFRNYNVTNIHPVYSENKIYIKRGGNKRIVVNYEEVETLLSKYGFLIVELEQFNFQQQIQLFSNAKWLISIHGAGLTNMAFMKESSQICEFSKPNEFMDKCYFNMSRSLGFNYYYLCGEPEKIDQCYSDVNLKIDILKLEKIVIAMNAT